MKRRKQKGITLIALVITVIVLLILAGVSIATLTGNNGILTRANEAKEKSKEAEKQENKMFGTYETTIGNIVDGTITAQVIANASNKNEYYGKVVTNYVVDSSVFDNDIQWKIFYSGSVGNDPENNIYLIASNYVKYINLPAGIDENGNITQNTLTKGSTDYSAYWDRNNPKLLNTYKTGSLRITNFKIKALNNDYFNIKKYSSQENNMKAVSYMLDTNAWSDYSNKTYSDYAIGGPTIEMLIKSYNQKLGLTGNKEYKTKANSANGYQISKDGGYEWSSNGYNSMLSYSEDLYVIPNSKNGIPTANAYWIASPSDDYNYYLFGAYHVGDVKSNYYSIDDRGFRPVVCLKSNVQLKKVENGYEIVNID